VSIRGSGSRSGFGSPPEDLETCGMRASCLRVGRQSVFDDEGTFRDEVEHVLNK
jgi:hypothetical protein